MVSMKTTRFNLLPSLRRASVARFATFRFFRGLLIALFATLAIFSVLLFAGRQILNPKLALQRERAANAERFVLGAKRTTLSQEILALNKKLGPAQALQAGFVKWSSLLPRITNLLPAGIVVTRLTLSADSRTATIEGTATTRTTLLDLQTILEATQILDNLSLPSVNFLQRENIPFSMTADLILQ